MKTKNDNRLLAAENGWKSYGSAGSYGPDLGFPGWCSFGFSAFRDGKFENLAAMLAAVRKKINLKE